MGDLVPWRLEASQKLEARKKRQLFVVAKQKASQFSMGVWKACRESWEARRTCEPWPEQRPRERRHRTSGARAALVGSTAAGRWRVPGTWWCLGTLRTTPAARRRDGIRRMQSPEKRGWQTGKPPMALDGSEERDLPGSLQVFAGCGRQGMLQNSFFILFLE